ncbi:PKD domain-containing protein [Carboxylicivirga sp. N1Y90]|uniref:PKD domain-containing protein n=1 Tax=Carboxylicivirga fragile TaxID=3417571 RepID=UPI003D34C2A2|nr:PKD domain-containing protein [Marinilabiliaceae bacterium N1Y90]
MGIYTQALIKNRLSGKIASLMLILLLFVAFIPNSSAQINACADGVLQLGNTFDDMVPVPVNGHRNKGYWSSSPALTFTNVNDPLAIVSGFVLGNTYTITWHHQGGNDYVLTVNTPVTADVGVWSLLNESGNSNGVVLCGKSDHLFEIPWDGDFGLETFDYWVTHDSDGTSEVWAANVPNRSWPPGGSESEIKTNEYDNLDLVWAVIVDDDGCQIRTNEIMISDIAGTQVRVQGGASACQAAVHTLGLSLEVLPFDVTNYTYRWYRNGGLVATDVGTFPITQVGDYYVEVDGCGSTYISNTVQVTENILPDALLVGGDICENPVGGTTTLSATFSGGNIGAYDLSWIRNGAEDPLMGTINPTTTDAVGAYELKMTSSADDQCWKLSNTHVVGTTSPIVNVFEAVQPGTCLTTYAPTIRRQITGGTLNYTLKLEESGRPDRFITVSDNSNLTTSLGGSRNANTIIELTEVTDANGCITSSVLPMAANFTFTPAATPSVLTINGTDVCTPTATTVNVPASQNNIEYYLTRNGVEVAPSSRQTGDGTTLTWNVSTVGFYQVYAVDPCDAATPVLMDGIVYIDNMPNLQNMTRITGAGCSNVTHVFGLDASEDGVTYTLYFNGAPHTTVAPVDGNVSGTAISFTGVTAPGAYQVWATRRACEQYMTGSFNIDQAPIVTGINIVGGDGCSNELRNIGINANEAGVTYDLILDGNVAIPIASIVGDGTAGTKNFFNLNTTLADGLYTVRVTALNTCEDWLAGSITIHKEPDDLAFTTSGQVCGTGDVIIPVGEAGVTYTLYEGAPAVSTGLSLLGNGTNPVAFNTLGPGYYTVYAEVGTCSKFLTDFLEVETQPLPQVVNIPDDNYCSNETGISIIVAASQANLDYELYNLGTSTVDQTITAINASGVTFNNVLAGNYEVRVVNNSCTLVLRTGILIVEYAVTTPNANIPSSFCSDQGAQTISGWPPVVAGSSTGLYTIIGGAGFDPGHTTDINAGTLSFNPANCAFNNIYTIRYEYTDGNGCVAEDVETTIVYDLANGAITINSAVPANPCQDDNTDYLLEGLLSGGNVGGTFTCSTPAALNTPDVANGTVLFNPFDAGNGVHNITFTYVDPVSNCTGNANITITIGTPLNMVGFGANYCSNDNTYKTLTANQAGGTFSIYEPSDFVTPIESGIPNGNNDKLNPKTYFDAYGDGTYRLIYTYNNAGCINTLITDFQIVESIDATFTFPINGGVEQTTFCVNDANALLTPNGVVAPANITSFFSGNGVAGSFFIPSDPNVVFSPAQNPISHQVTNTVNGFTCTTTSTRNATVAEVDISFSGLNNTYCENVGTSIISLNGADAATGTATFSSTNNSNPSLFITDNGDNTATLDPGVGPGVYEVQVEFIKSGDLCERILIQTVTVLASTPVTFSGYNDGDNVCSSSAIINLVASPVVGAGVGNYILLGGGPGLDNGVADDGIATLDPSLMTPGTYTIRYDYTNPDACDTYFEKSIIISDAPATTHVVTGGGAYCNDAAIPGVFIGLGSATVGVQYELLLNNNPVIPAATYTPVASGAFNFTDDNTTTGADRYFTATGTYTVRAILVGCSAIMSGDVSVEQYELTLTTSNVTPVSCKDDNDGSITLLAGGGSGSYQYRMESPVLGAWTANPVFSGLEDDTYVFSVRDLSIPSLCEKTSLLSVDITEPALALSVSEDASKRINVGCVPCSSPGTCEGSATLIITGGTPFTDLVTYPSGYDITWSASANNQTTITAVELDVDTHSVTVTDANGCVQLINITISADNPLAVVEYDPATNHIDNVCFGGNDGSFMVQASEGSGQYLFSIDGTNYYPSNHATDPTLHTFSGLAAGTYTVYLRDLVNPRCNFTIGTDVIITEPAAGLSLVETLNNQVSCYGGSDGSFTVQAFGGNGFYEFSSVNPSIALPADWIDNGTNEFTVAGVVAGNHSVWVRDRDNPTCTGSTIVVNVSQVVQLSLTAPIVQNVTCHLGNDGQIELLGAGGSGNYVYSIDGGAWQASNVFSGLSEGTYQFSIAESADPVGCQRVNILSVTLTQPADFNISEVLASHINVSCNGGNDGEFEVLAVGGVGLKQFRLHDGTNYITAWDANPVFSNLSEGTYEVSVRDRVNAAPVQWCEKDRILSVTISQPAAALAITSAIVTDAPCYGTASGSVSITVGGGTPGYNYQWTHVPSNTPVSLADGGQSANAINLIAGDYRVDITDANSICSLSNTYTVGEIAEIQLTLATSQDPTCYGAIDGTITVNAVGGSGTYEYSYNGGAWVLGPAGTYTINAIGAGTYNIQVRDAALATCVSTDVVSVNLIQPAELDLFASSITHLTCNGTGDGAITITGVGRTLVTDYDYYCQEIGTWQTSPDFTLLNAGTYHFKVRDRINPTCESALSSPVVITEPVDFTTTATVTHITCNGANDGELTFATIPATGTYQYSLDGGPWLASPIKNLAPGTYSIKVRDVSNGCIKVIPDEVVTEPLAAINIDNSILTHVDCNGNANGTVEVIVSGGTPVYTYQWRNMTTGVDVPPAQNGDQAKAINLTAGDYQVTIMDANLCSLVSPLYTVTQPAVLTTTYSVDHITVVGLTDGRIVVANPPIGGTAPYTITWADGAPATDGLWTRDNLSQGTYTFTIEDSRGCTFVQDVIVLANLALDVSVVPNTINCYADQTGILAVNINGGTAPYDISWTGTLYDGSTDSGTDTNVATNYEIKPLYAGTYSVTITDDNSISQTITNAIISQPNELVINQLVLDDISCNAAGDGRIQVELAGHLPADMANYNMSWTGPGGYAVAGLASAVSDQPNLVLPGDYTVTVNYNGTCAVSQTFTISEPSAITTTFIENHISSAGANDGQIIVTNPPTGGVAPYTIAWADGAGAFDGMWTRTNLVPGPYDFTITDNAGTGCSVSYSATILDANALDFTYTVTPVNCYADQAGVIAMVVTGGTGPFDLEWDAVLFDGSTDNGTSNNITTNYELKPLFAGTYNVKVTDSKGAVITYPIVVTQPNELVINTVTQDDISCNGAADGHLQVSLSGHVPADMDNYTMTWSGPGGFSASGPASTTSDQPNLVLPGNYIVTVNYNSSCNVSLTLAIDEPTAIAATHTETHISVAGLNDGQIVVDNPPSGGLAPYSITWDDGAAFDDLWTRTNLSPGTYTYTITDANTCTFVQPVTILDVAALDFVVVPNTINCFAAQTGILAVTVSGGKAPLDIAWSGTLYDGSTDTGSNTDITTNYEIKPLYAGTYSVTITDDNGATMTKTNIVITQPDELVINQLVLDDISCNGAGDGRIQVELAGHLPADMANYNMSWTGPGGFAVAGLASAVSDQPNLVLPGDYTVTVNYNGTCAVSETYTINEPSAVTTTFTEIHISSAGANDGQIIVTNPPTGGVAPYTISWSDGAGAFDGMWTRSLLAPGSYDFTITDNAGAGCSESYTATILDVDALDYTYTVIDVNCYSDQTGTIALVLTGGVGPYDLQWDAVLFDGSTDSGTSAGINTNHEINNLYAGTYNVKISDSKGAEIAYSIVVAQPGELVINNIVQDDISCAGAGDGHLQVSLSGHLPADINNYTMTWIGPGGFSVSGPAGTTSDQPNLVLPGNYTVTVNYNSTCNVSETYVIDEPTSIVISETVTQISVVGANDGMIVVDNPPTGGVAPYTITWADGAAFDGLWTRDNLVPGSYTYTVRDNSATCSASNTLDIDELQALDYSVSANVINCYGGNTGTISVIINGGKAPFDIEWDGTLFDGSTVTDNDAAIASNYEIKDLYAGSYTIKITDGNSSELSKVIVVGQAEEVTVIEGVNSPISCFGAADGSLQVNVVQGITDVSAYPIYWTGPGGYSLSGTVGANSTISGLALQGTYTATVSYNGTCTVSTDIILSEPDELTISLVPAQTNDVSCNGGIDGQIGVSVTGGFGYSYQWAKWNGAAFADIAGETNPIITGRDAGRYRVTATLLSTSCPVELEYTIVEPDALTLTVAPIDVVTCNGDNTGELSLVIDGGVQPYRYNYGSGDVVLPVGQTNDVIENLNAGFYDVIVTDNNNCTISVINNEIKQPAALNVAVITETISCEADGAGWPDGELEIDITGGRVVVGSHFYMITLEPSSGAAIVRSVSNLAGNTLRETFSGLLPDDYVLKVYDQNSQSVDKCIYTYPFTLELIDISGNEQDATCEGVADGKITGVSITGASPTYTYTWTSPDGGVGFDPNTLDQDGLSVGTYRLTIDDTAGRGCVVSHDFVIGYANEILVDASIIDVECFGDATGSITLDVTGVGATVNYLWTGPGITPANETDKDLTALVAGDYTVQVSDAINMQMCYAVETFTVNQASEALNFNLRYLIRSCDPYIRTIEIFNLVGGTGNQDPASGDFKYNVSGPGVITVDPADYLRFDVGMGGTYTVQVLDKNDCSTSYEITIPNEVFIAPVVTDVKCNAGTTGAIAINLTGGSGSFTYDWTKTGDAGFSESTPNLSGLTAGEYVLTITDNIESDGTACSRTYTINVNEPQPIVISVDDKGDVTCNGDGDGYVNIDIQGGAAPYTYNWNPAGGGIIQGDKNQSGLIGGTYTITVTDANLCTASQNVTIVEPDVISGTLAITDTQCDGTNGAIVLTPSGGSGTYLYSWSTSDGDASNIVAGAKDQSGLTGGTYTVVITDADPARSGCQTTLSATLTQAIDVINVVVTDVTCAGNNDGSITFDVVGGDSNYTYTWSTADGNPAYITPGVQNQNGLTAGTYTVVIRDGRISGGTDCEITRSFTIDDATGLSVNVAIDHVKCNGASTGSLSAVVNGGSGSYSYDWNGGVYTTAAINNVPAGIYTLVVEDLTLGCTYTNVYTITQPTDGININVVNIIDNLCKDEALGEIEVLVTGGTAPYTYFWTGPSPATGTNPTNLLAGTYTLSITDENGCVLSSGDIDVGEPATHVTVTNPDVTNATAPGFTDGEIAVTVTGGASPYTFEWYEQSDLATVVSTTNPATGLGSGTYNVIAFDQNNCSFDYTGIKVSEPGEALGFVETVMHVSPCNGLDNGELIIVPFGGFKIDDTDYRIQINGPGTNIDTRNTRIELVDRLPGVYTVTVDDASSPTVSRNITVNEYPPLTITTTKVSDVNCYGTSTGEINVLVGGGSPNASGYYLVEIVSAEGYYNSKADVLENTAFSFSNLPVGNYTITVTDHAADFDTKAPNRGSCQASDVKLILQPVAEVAINSQDGSSAICDGDNFNLALTTTNWDYATQGDLLVTVYDGFTYTEVTVDQTPFIHTVSPNTSRNYEVTKVADPITSTCLKGTGSGIVALTVNGLATATITGSSEVCDGGEVQLSVALTGKAPWTITWVDDNNGTTFTESGILTSPFTFTDTPIADASYRISNVTDDNTCDNAGVGVVDVILNPNPSVSLSGSQDICIGDNAVLVIDLVTNETPYTITYEENGEEKLMGVSPSSGSTYNWTVSPTETTTYVITNVVDAKGCVMPTGALIQAVVTVNLLPGDITAINSTDDTDGVCQSATGVTYTIDPVSDADGGYVWTAPANSTIISGNGTMAVALNFDVNFTGGYLNVYPTNACGDGKVVERWIPAKLLPEAVGAITGPNEFCQGSTDITFSVDPVANATSYRWELPTGFIIQGDDSAASILVNLDPMLDVITGDVKVTAVNNCGDGPNTATQVVNVYPLPTADAGTDDPSHCGNSYTLNATDPTSINAAWSGQWEVVAGYAVIANVNAHNSNVTNMSRGDVTFRWTVTNNSTGGLNDCDVYDEVTIRNNTLSVTATAASTNVCNGSTSLSGTIISTANTTGLWEAVFPVGSTASFSVTDQANTTVTNMMPDRNVFRWTLIQNGCESYGEVEVINNEPSDVIITQGASLAVCDNQVTLDAVPPVEGSGKWTLVSGSGVIDSPNTPSTLITGLDYGDNVFRYTVDKNGCGKYADITVRNNTLQVDAGPDQTVCDGTLLLDATVPPSGVTGRWYIPLGEGAGSFDDAFSPTATVSGLDYGINRLVWELTQDGCISTDEIIITNNEPTEATVGSNQVLCSDDAVLSGNLPSEGTGFWSIVSGSGEFDDVNDPITTVRKLQEGDNVFRWSIIKNGCTSSADIMITNLHVYVNAGKDSVICGRTTTLKANTPTIGTGEWSVLPGVGGATFSDINDPHSLVGGLQNGANGFIWKITYSSCESRDTVIINNNTPYPVNAGTDQIIFGGTTFLNATPVTAGVGTWSLISGGGAIADATDPYSEVSGLRRGDNVFRWTVDNAGCTEFDDVIITNGETIDADAGLDQEICEDYTILQANDPDVGIGEWSVVTGSGKIESIHNQKTRVYDLGPGANVFRWTIYYTNSSSTDDVIITNNKVTTANAGPDREICGDSYQLEANIPAIPATGGATWSIISGSGTFDDEKDPNTFVRGLAQGENVLKYEIAQLTCRSVDTVRITNMLPTTAYAGEDEVICTDSMELRPNTPTFGVGEWRVSEGSADFVGNWAKNLAPGRNVLTWVITSGSCVSSDDVIIINNQPSTAFAGQDRIICVDNVNLSANIPQYGVGTWELISGSGIITDVSDPNSNVTGIGSGKNRFRWTIDNNGCTSSDDVEIANNYIQSVAGFDQINCADTALLEANTAFPGEGTWGVVGGSGSAYFDEPHNPYSKVRNLDQGDNVLTWTISYDGCNSVSNITITNNNPTKSLAGPDQALCIENAVLAGNAPTIGEGAWSVREGSGGFTDITDPSSAVSNLAFGDNIFRWTITHQSCVSIDDVQISFNRIDAAVGPDQPICSDETILEANNASPGVGTWTVIGGSSQAVFDDQNNPNTTVRNLAKGDNRLLWTILNKGCETSAEVTITNNSPSDAYAGNSQTICEDVTTLDATAVSIGVGRWEVLSGSGTIADINDPKTEVTGLSKDNVFRWTVQNGICSLSDEVLVINNRPPEPYAGKDEELCTPQLRLKANPIDAYPGVTGLWTIESGAGNFDDPTSESALVTNLNPGTNVLRWTLTQGQCTLMDEIIVENNSPSIANAGPDVFDCRDWSQLDANAPEYGVGSWTVVSGRGDFEDVTDPKTTVRNLGFDENILMWSIQNGSCFSTDQVIITNKVPDQSEAGSDRNTCDDYIVLNANNPVSGTGIWTVISGSGDFEDATKYNTLVNNLGFGENVFKWTISYGESGECTTEDEVKITSNLANPFAGEDDVTYEPEYAMQAANPGSSLTGTWTIVAGGGTFDDVNFFNSTVRDLPVGKSTFRWTIETDGCSAYDEVTIDYREVPEAGFTVDVSEGCYPLDVKFTNYSVGGSVWSWEFGDGGVSDQRNPSYTYEDPGRYTAILTVQGPDGNDAVYSEMITVHDHPTANFSVGPEVVYIPGESVKCYDLSIDAVKWFWEFGDGSSSEEHNPSYEYQDPGFYDITLRVESQYGCEDTFIQEDIVEAKMSGFVSFPDAFAPRPGGNGSSGDIGERNDAIFKPKYRDVEEYHIQIFNRWGQLIFESHDVDEGWDGMYQNKLAPQAVYVFKASGRFVNGREFQETGSILLIR